MSIVQSIVCLLYIVILTVEGHLSGELTATCIWNQDSGVTLGPLRCDFVEMTLVTPVCIMCVSQR